MLYVFKSIFSIIGIFILFALLLAYLVGLLMIMTISLVYLVGYMYDTIMDNWMYKISNSKSLKQKIQKFVPRKVFRWLEKETSIKDTYLRYETPICAYCFSYTSIALIMSFLPQNFGEGIQLLVGGIIYLLVYFIGMFQKYSKNQGRYVEVLNNNLEFLKLSFIPITFLITIFGFLFTVTGWKVQDIDFGTFIQIYKEITNYDNNISLVYKLFQLLIIGLILIIVLYIISLPLQIVSYFIILVIKYFRQHAKPHKQLMGKYRDVLKYLWHSIL